MPWRRSGGTGRRAGLKIRFPSGSVGSIPTFGIDELVRLAASGTQATRYAQGSALPGHGADAIRATSRESTIEPSLGGGPERSTSS